jgi:predicted pyridoxine 5'-phosphate oxidase superfamily flavin-nucleotide-binding protein
MPVTDMSELRVLYPPPKAQAGLKILDHLDVHCRDFIALSPFYVISSARGTVRSTRCRTWWSAPVSGCCFSFPE